VVGERAGKATWDLLGMAASRTNALLSFDDSLRGLEGKAVASPAQDRDVHL